MGRRGPELSPQLRSRICELRSYGLSHSRIKALHPEVPLGTIKSTLRLEKQRLDNQSKPRSGAPRKLTEEQRDQIYDTITHIDPHITTKDLLDSVDNACKERSLRYLLREMGRRRWIQKKRPLLKPEHAEKRRQWVARYENIDWKTVKWSDECYVIRGQGARPVWTFLSPREQLLQGDVKESSPQGAVRQMFWALFGASLRTGLMALHGRVDGEHICDLYQAILPEVIKPGDIFMHDNASSHTARIVKALLDELNIKTMIWPPYSPDLNPIENLWALMKAEIYRLHPELEFMDDTVKTQYELVKAAKEAWHSIADETLENLISTMPNRVAAVKAADGWYTKY